MGFTLTRVIQAVNREEKTTAQFYFRIRAQGVCEAMKRTVSSRTVKWQVKLFSNRFAPLRFVHGFPPLNVARHFSRRFVRCFPLPYLARLAFLVPMILATVLGCQSRFETGSHVLSIGDDPQFTGALTDDGRPITAADGDGEIQNLKRLIDAKQPQNIELAKAIETVEIERLTAESEPTEAPPERLRIRISLNKEIGGLSHLTFDASLSLGESQKRGFHNAPSRPEPSTFFLNATCGEESCQKVTFLLTQLIEITKNRGADRSHSTNDETAKNQTEKKEVARAGFIVRLRQAVAQARLGTNANKVNPFMSNRSPHLKMLYLQYGNPAADLQHTATFNTTEVAWGTAQYILRLGQESERVCLIGLLVQTNENDEEVTTTCASATALKAKLLGNSNSGNLAFELAEGADSLYLLSTISRKMSEMIDESHPTLTPDKAIPAAEGAHIPADHNHPITRMWERDRTRADVTKVVSAWQKSKHRVQAFVTRVQPNIPVIKKNLNQHQVPTELIAITLLESKFFVDPGYPLEVNSAGSTAAGPWQFLDNTAKSLGLTIRPFRKDHSGRRVLDPCDGRAQLGPSTNAAGRYFREFFDAFPRDPRLAIMSYRWGQGNVNQVVKCMKSRDCLRRRVGDKAASRIEEIQRVGFDFWNVREFNMAPRAVTDYVVGFLGAQFIGRDPKRYGFEPYTSQYLGGIGPVPNRCR